MEQSLQYLMCLDQVSRQMMTGKKKKVQHTSAEQRTVKLSGHTTDLETMYHTMEPVKLDELDPFAIAIK